MGRDAVQAGALAVRRHDRHGARIDRSLARISARHRETMDAARLRSGLHRYLRKSSGSLADLPNDVLVLLAGRHLDVDAIMALSCCCRSLHAVGRDPQVWEWLLRRHHDEIFAECGFGGLHAPRFVSDFDDLKAMRLQVMAGCTTPCNDNECTWPSYCEWVIHEWREKRSVWERSRKVELEWLERERREEAVRQHYLFVWRVLSLAFSPPGGAVGWFWILLSVILLFTLCAVCEWARGLEPIARAANRTATADDLANAGMICTGLVFGSLPVYGVMLRGILF